MAIVLWDDIETLNRKIQLEYTQVYFLSVIAPLGIRFVVKIHVV